MKTVVLRSQASAAVLALRSRPQHLLLFAVCVGLLLGPRIPFALAPLAALLALLAGRPLRIAAVIAVLLAATWLGDARLHAFDANPLKPWFGHVIEGEAQITASPQRMPSGAWRAPVKLLGEWHGARAQILSEGLVPAARTGAIIRFKGAVRGLEEDEEYLRQRGIRAVISSRTAQWDGAVRGGVAGILDTIRRRAVGALTAGLPQAEGALLLGMVLGDASGLSNDDTESLRDAGLTHIVAASGANVALLVSLVFGLGVLLNLGIRTRLFLALAAIAIYVPLAGAGPSIQRAGVMGAVTLVALLAGRAATRFYALMLAAAITTLIAPRSISDPGWQLSFAAVLGLLLGVTPLAGRLARRLPQAVAEVVSVTAIATIAAAPIIAWHFGRVSLISLPANVLVAAAIAPVMWLGTAAAVAGQLWPGAALVLTKLAGIPVAFVLAVGRWAASFPNATIATSPLAVTAATAVIVLVALGISAPFSRRLRRDAALVAGLLTVALIVAVVGRRAPPPVTPMPDTFQIAFLDVGQGDSTLLRDGEHAILIDSGPPDAPILKLLRRLGVKRLDVLAISHAQADHDGGAAEVLRAMPVGLLLDGRHGVIDGFGTAAVREAERQGVRVAEAQAGTIVRAGPISLTVLWPPQSGDTGSDPNEQAVVALAQYNGVRVLLPADAESGVLSRLGVGPVDVLKVAHHGSADPGLPRLLEELRPQLAGIEVGANNSYGHPTPSTLEALNTAVPTVVRTDRNGTVLVTAGIDGRFALQSIR